MATSRRLSTIHDLAALRLHADGTRVPNSDRNVRIRKAKYTARDSRGNWFARDAGGTGNVKQRWAHPRDDADDTEEEETTERPEEDVQNMGRKGKRRASSVEEEDAVGELLMDRRAQKRQRFYGDESFVARPQLGDESIQESTGASSSGSTESDTTAAGELPTPSAETLKCMHYYACTYYTAMGHLRDSTREARHHRRQQKLQEQVDGGETKAIAEGRDTEIASGNRNEEEDGPMEEENDPPSDSEGENDGVDVDMEYQPRHHLRRRRRENPDMYKSFDGSALMAIAMFVQEHVVQLLSSDPPAGWEVEMTNQEQAQLDKQPEKQITLPRRRGRKKVYKSSEFVEDEEDENLEGQQPTKEDSSKRQTRGAVVSESAVPFADDESEDDDYVP